MPQDLPIFEPTHYIYVKLEIEKKFPGKKLYFMADYPRAGYTKVPELDFADKKTLSDDLFFKINPEHLKEIQDRKAFLVYDAYVESGEVFIMWLYEKCIKANIPTEQVIVIGSSFDYTDICEKYATHYNVTPITHVFYSFFERYTRRLFLSKITGKRTASPADAQSIVVKGPLDVNQIEKRFIFLNYTSRIHRHALLMMLYRDDLLKHGYVSFHNKITEKDFDNLSYMLDYFDEPVKTIIKEGAGVKDLLPIKLDDTKITPLTPNPALSLPDHHIQTSFLHIATETFYGTGKDWVNTTPGSPDYRKDKNQECTFLTEKIFNCIPFKQPFIAVTYPNSLAALRKLGYKTFDGIIDESYDTEIDDTKRLYKIYCEIKRICELDADTLEEYRLKLIPILEYNYNLWLNKTNYMH
jgi:hypothetical protein